MPKQHSKRTIIRACRLSFEGELTPKEIAAAVGVVPITLRRWRKLALWKETEAKLIEKEIEKETDIAFSKEFNDV